MAKLKPKQRKFAAEYARTGNATKAAIKAGYSKKTARKIASENLTKPDIQRAVDKSVEKITHMAELKAADVLIEIQKLAFVNIKDAYDKNGKLKNIHDMPEPMQKALAGLEVDELFFGRGSDKQKIGETKKIKVFDKVRSLEMLAKHFKLLTEVQEHTGTLALGVVDEKTAEEIYKRVKGDC